MRFSRSVQAALSVAAIGLLLPQAESFTNGTLLPGYLCGPPTDGLPKSVGTLLPYLQLGTALDGYDQFPPGNGTVAIQILQDPANNVGAFAPPAKMIIGSFHNGQPSTGYIEATKNVIVVVPTSANTLTGAGNYVITPGAIHNLTLVVNSPAFNPAGIALDGAFVYAIDTATGGRIGSFLSAGASMTNWSACTLNNFELSRSVGIVHHEVLSDCASYGGLLWKAPKHIVGTVQFMGAGVCDAGYGPYATVWNTTTNHTAPPISSIIRPITKNLSFGGAAVTSNGPFFLSTATTTLPQEEDIFDVATATDDGSSGMQTSSVALIAAGSAIGGLAVGIASVGGAWMFVNRKNRFTRLNNDVLLE